MREQSDQSRAVFFNSISNRDFKNNNYEKNEKCFRHGSHLTGCIPHGVSEK